MLKTGVEILVHQILYELEALDFGKGQIFGVQHFVGRLIRKHAAELVRLLPQARTPQELEKA